MPACSTTYGFCVGKLKMSEDVACKRICAARAARRFPFILHALADGRLRLSGVVMLAPRLIEATAEELLAAAVDKTTTEIEHLLAERFPKRDAPTLIVPLSPTPATAPAQAPALQLEPSVETPAESPAVPTAPPPTDLSAARRMCRAHNHYEAERVYGAEFMRQKREAARGMVPERRVRRPDAAGAAGQPAQELRPGPPPAPGS